MNLDASLEALLPARQPSAADGELLPLRVHGTTYAIPADCVRECRDLPPIVRIPDAPRYVEGVFDLRGDIVPVVDLCARLSPQPPGADARLVVVVIDERDVALLVHGVGSRFRADPASLRPPPGFHAAQPEPFITGLVHHAERLVLLLDLPALLDGICRSLLGSPALPALPAGCR